MFKKSLDYLFRITAGTMLLASVHCSWSDDDDHDHYDSACVNVEVEQKIESQYAKGVSRSFIP
jgi:hypothetical protein